MTAKQNVMIYLMDVLSHEHCTCMHLGFERKLLSHFL